MSIYRTGNSPFWHVRIYDNLRKRYIVRSSKEKARLTAKEVAEELFDEHRSKKNQAVAVSRDTSFRHYAEKLQAHEKAMAARMRGKRFFTDTRAILAPTVRKGSKEKRIGMLEYFGDYDVSKITAGMVREYFQKVDEKRDTPLAASTKAKHGMVMRKVLTLAYEDGLIDTLPPMPKNRVKDNPRTSFSDRSQQHGAFVGALLLPLWWAFPCLAPHQQLGCGDMGMDQRVLVAGSCVTKVLLVMVAAWFALEQNSEDLGINLLLDDRKFVERIHRQRQGFKEWRWIGGRDIRRAIGGVEIRALRHELDDSPSRSVFAE